MTRAGLTDSVVFDTSFGLSDYRDSVSAGGITMTNVENGDVAHSGTGAGLTAFLDWAGGKGELNPTTAKLYRSTVKKVLAVEDDWQHVDVRKVNVDNLLDRFEMLNRTRYSQGSMATYRTRFRQATEMYRAWLERRPDWKVAAGRTVTIRRKRAAKASATDAGSKAPAPNAPDRSEPVRASSDVRLIAYDLPLRPDLVVRLNLPIDLTATDAARVATFVESLAFGDSSASAAASETAGGSNGD
jgi:hypothetical protein